jgi:S1-C subfamily serine protease
MFGSHGKWPVSDIYNERFQNRDVVPVHAAVRRGDSGGPVVNARGDVVAMVFAVEDEVSDLAWATGSDDVQRALHQANSSHVPKHAGRCLKLTDAPKRGHKPSNSG